MAEVTGLAVYPVKSLGGIALEEAVLTPHGIKYDRNWVITDSDGHFITQRELPRMAAIRISLTKNELCLSSASNGSFSLSLNQLNAEPCFVTVWDDICRAFDEGNPVSSWLTKVLCGRDGQEIRLRRFDHAHERAVEKEFLNGDNAQIAFADGYPFLIANESSLEMLNGKLTRSRADAVPMNRFRPNIIVNGLEPFEENSLPALENETFSFKLRKPSKRCKVITVDQENGEIPNLKEPLRTLAAMKTVPGHTGAYFGQNATLHGADEVRITLKGKLTPRK